MFVIQIQTATDGELDPAEHAILMTVLKLGYGPEHS